MYDVRRLGIGRREAGAEDPVLGDCFHVQVDRHVVGGRDVGQEQQQLVIGLHFLEAVAGEEREV